MKCEIWNHTKPNRPVLSRPHSNSSLYQVASWQLASMLPRTLYQLAPNEIDLYLVAPIPTRPYTNSSPHQFVTSLCRGGWNKNCSEMQLHILHNNLIPPQRKKKRSWQLIPTYLDVTMGPTEATCHIFNQSFYVLMPIREGQRKIVLKWNCLFFAPSRYQYCTTTTDLGN